MVLVILFEDLPVGIEQPGLRRTGRKGRSGSPPGRSWSRSSLRREWQGAHRFTRSRSASPEVLHGEREVLHRQPGHGRRLGPFHVQGARPMAGLAAHGDLAPGGLVGVLLRVVALADPGGVALRAHHIPVLGGPGPVEPVRRGDDLVGVQRVPAFLLDVPGDGEGLQPPPGKGDQVLLEREPPEGVGHLELAGLAVGAFGAHEVLPVFSEEPRGLPLLREGGIVEVAQDGVLAGGGHRQGVIGADATSHTPPGGRTCTSRCRRRAPRCGRAAAGRGRPPRPGGAARRGRWRGSPAPPPPPTAAWDCGCRSTSWVRPIRS